MPPTFIGTPTYAITTNPALSYLTIGSAGSPVLLLHGWGAFKELWWSTMLALAPHFRVFAPDLPGHGGSPLGAHHDMPSLAQTIADFCTAQGLEDIILVGHSMGGAVAAELALQHPALIKRLVLVDAAVDAYRLPAYIRIYLADTLGWPALRLSLLLGDIVRPVGDRIPQLHGGGWIRPWIRRSIYLARTEPEGLLRLLRVLLAAQVGPRLAQIAVPTLVVSGQFDSLVPAPHSRRTAQHIPGAHYINIRGTLHNPMDERPRAFERVLLEFLLL